MRWERGDSWSKSRESEDRAQDWPKKLWMRYTLAILVPPLAVFKCRRPTQTALNVALTLCFYLPGVAHAAIMVFDHYEEQRAQNVVNAIRAWQKRAAV